jgi:TolA-binding protein
MAETKTPVATTDDSQLIEKVQQVWSGYRNIIVYSLAAVILVVGGFFVYKNQIRDPNEKKANDALYHAEAYYRMDSLNKALNGDNINVGFLKIISKFSGTKAAKLSEFYAGSCYLHMGDFANAVKHLKDFTTPVQQIQARAYAMLGDAYSEQNKKDDAVEQYKKAANTFSDDNIMSPEYLFKAGYLYENLGKNKEAIEMYQQIKDKYPASTRATEINKYLARLGAVK